MPILANLMGVYGVQDQKPGRELKFQKKGNRLGEKWIQITKKVNFVLVGMKPKMCPYVVKEFENGNRGTASVTPVLAQAAILLPGGV